MSILFSSYILYLINGIVPKSCIKLVFVYFYLPQSIDYSDSGRPFLSQVAYTWQLEFLTLVSFYHEYYPEHDSDNPYYPVNKGYKTEDRAGSERNNRLHGMELYEVAFLFYQEEYKSRDPTDDITQQPGNILFKPRRRFCHMTRPPLLLFTDRVYTDAKHCQ